MSRFYASIQGNKSEATRQGNSRIHGHIRGWNVGVKVLGFINEKRQDEIVIYLTSGSKGVKKSIYIGNFTEEDLK